MAVQLQIRRDTISNWTSANPVLANGELGYVSDTDKLKVGDGTTAFNTLVYSNIGPQGIQGIQGIQGLHFVGVGAVSVPVNVGLAKGAFNANPVFIVFNKVVAKVASLLIAVANSFKVSKASGELAIRLSIAVFTKAVLAT